MDNMNTATTAAATANPCDVCGQDIFPRVRTRETGAKCLNCCTGRQTTAAIRKQFPEAYYVAGVGWCGPQWQEAAALELRANAS